MFKQSKMTNFSKTVVFFLVHLFWKSIIFAKFVKLGHVIVTYKLEVCALKVKGTKRLLYQKKEFLSDTSFFTY